MIPHAKESSHTAPWRERGMLLCLVYHHYHHQTVLAPGARGCGVVKLASSPPPKTLQFQEKQSIKDKQIQGQAETNAHTLTYSLKQKKAHYHSIRMGGRKTYCTMKNVLNQESRELAAYWTWGSGLEKGTKHRKESEHHTMSVNVAK